MSTWSFSSTKEEEVVSTGAVMVEGMAGGSNEGKRKEKEGVEQRWTERRKSTTSAFH